VGLRASSHPASQIRELVHATVPPRENVLRGQGAQEGVGASHDVLPLMNVPGGHVHMPASNAANVSVTVPFVHDVH
jgi:hypothetical protein